MMRHRIGNQRDAEFFGDLRHDRGLADTRRTDHENRSLPFQGNAVVPEFVFHQINTYTAFDFFFCVLNIHASNSVSGSTSRIAHGGTDGAAKPLPANMNAV